MAQSDSATRNDAPRSSTKRVITKLLFVDKVQNKWAKSVVGAISTTIIISLLTLVATTLYQEGRQFFSEIQNISQDEALAVARQNIGTDTVEAIHPAIPEPYNGPRIGKIDPDPYKSFGVSLERSSGFGRARGLPADNSSLTTRSGYPTC